MSNVVKSDLTAERVRFEGVAAFSGANIVCFDASARRMKIDPTARVLQGNVTADTPGFHGPSSAFNADIAALRIYINCGHLKNADVTVACSQLHSRAARHIQFDFAGRLAKTRLCRARFLIKNQQLYFLCRAGLSAFIFALELDLCSLAGSR